MGLPLGKYFALRIENHKVSAPVVIIFHHHLIKRHLFIIAVLMMPNPRGFWVYTLVPPD